MTFSIAESHRFLLSYSLFQPLQIIRIRVRKSLVEILDHCVQMGQGVANFGYASALSFVIFVMVAILSFISMKAGDKRD